MNKVGIVSKAEKEQILLLYERKNALEELCMTLDSPQLTGDERHELSIKIAADQEKTIKAYEDWWKHMGMKYGWKEKKDGSWKIDFETNEVFLV